jgi:hypothetical protein
MITEFLDATEVAKILTLRVDRVWELTRKN